MIAGRQTAMFLVLVVLSLPGLSLSFRPLSSSDGSATHLDITQRAVLRKTAEVCRDIAISEERDFNLTINDSLSFDKVLKACTPKGTSFISTVTSTITFKFSILYICLCNAKVDQVFLQSAKHHFDDETFQEGREVITAGVSAVKANVKRENFVAARSSLGQVFHTLQDFYSHSNWVELGNTAPYSTLIRPDQSFVNLAGPSTPTCRNCTGGNCENNLLPELMKQGLLTSGYFSISSSAKPSGKCSHGGSFDRTSKRDPVGGINKDEVRSSHGSLHHKAAGLAVNATVELLEDIRLAAGDRNFLRLMGISQSYALCFVIDTTVSMSDDIAEVKRVSFNIIDSKRGTLQEPSTYILVPFNGTGVGPLLVTSKADVFKDKINKLSASGGGDNSELCLSGLQLALTSAPPSSEIYVFTDAPAKDVHLKDTVTALIESTKSAVTFMLTDALTSRRRRRSFKGVSQSDSQLYRDLAQASGGQAIEVTKSNLSVATSVIEDSSAGVKVTVFQAVRNPGKPDNFTFTVDGSLRNVTAYITGAPSLTFSLTSSTGVSQNASQSSGPLASVTRAGNLCRLSLNTENQTGSWEVTVNSSDPYSVKVSGQSSVNFIYNLVEAHGGANGDFSLKEGRPLSGGNTSLLVTVAGSDTVKVTEVTLFDTSRPTEVRGSLQSVGSGNYFVTFSGVPAGDFGVRLRGEDSNSDSRSTPISFQRQSTTQLKTSKISVTAQASSTNIEPGSTISIPFTVATTISGAVNSSATFTVRANNDRGYSSSSPSNVVTSAGSGGTANGTVTLTVPASAASGTDVTLTIEVENAAATDFNYAVVRFSVNAKVTDITRPACQVISSSTSCASSSSLCASSQWEFKANFTDGTNGTGIESVTIRQGNGRLNISTVAGAGGENITVATYSGTCCSQNVELTAVDRAGNVGTCAVQAKASSSRGHTLRISLCVWIGVAVSILWK